MKAAFKVQWCGDEKEKDQYVSKIKDSYGFHSVTDFLNTVADLMLEDRVMFLKLEPSTVEKLKLHIKTKHFDTVEDFIKDRIRGELNG